MIDIPLEERVVGLQLRRTAERHPDRTFLMRGDDHLTYGAFDEHAGRVAGGLAELGFGRGDKLALMLPNSFEFALAWFGATRAGGIYVPVNTDYKGEVLRYQLDQADISHLVIEHSFLDRLAAVISGLPKVRHVIVRGPGEVPEGLRGRVALHAFESLIGASRRDRPDLDVGYADPHAISFTSGTTGPSKGVLAVNSHVVTFALDWMRCTQFQPGESIFSPLPQFHAIAAWLGIVPAILAGGRFAFSERFSASGYWDGVRRSDAAIAHGIFSMVPILLKQPPRPDDRDQPARAFYIGQRNAAFEERFGCRVIEVYGATETGIVLTSDYHGERRGGSCGRVNGATFDVALVDEDDRPVPVGQPGEIVVRPRQPFSMIREYYNMPEASLAAFRNLWFHTGDNARRDEDGFFYFLDRKKDAIRRRGENISSYEVESVVNRHDAVLECAAVAAPSELGEDEVKVVVVLQPEAKLSADDLWAFCDEHMPRFWVPRFIEFRSALPKTANQKIQKYLLRDGVDPGELFDRGAGRPVPRRAAG